MSSMQQPLMPGQSQAKTEEWIEMEKETANITCDRAVDATQFAKDSIHETKHETSSFLPQTTHEARHETSSFFQQTGEQMMHMAQGAVDSMKNTLGINNDKNN